MNSMAKQRPMLDQAVQSTFQSLADLLEQAASADASSDPPRTGHEAATGLKDVDFLPGSREDLPALTVVEGHVGIAMWAVPALCKLALNTLSELVAMAGQTTHDDVHALGVSSADTCSKVVLLIAADHSSVWNRRKSWIQQKLEPLRSAAGLRRRRRRRRSSASHEGRASERGAGDDELLHVIRKELEFDALVLTKHPKSAATWSHRGWLLRQVVADLRGSRRTTGAAAAAAGSEPKASARHPHGFRDSLPHTEILQQELDVCQRASDRHPRCYYAWIHRLQAARELPLPHVGREFHRVKKWLSTNVTDASAVHYLSQLQQLHLWRPCPSLSGGVPGDASPQGHARVGGPTPLQRMEAAQSHTLSTTMLSRRYRGHEALWAGRRAEFNLHVDMLLYHSPTAAHAQFHCQSIAATVDAAALELDELRSAETAGSFDDNRSRDAVLLHRCCLWHCFALRRAFQQDAPKAVREQLKIALARADKACASLTSSLVAPGASGNGSTAAAHVHNDDVVAVCAQVTARARQAQVDSVCPKR